MELQRKAVDTQRSLVDRKLLQLQNLNYKRAYLRRQIAMTKDHNSFEVTWSNFLRMKHHYLAIIIKSNNNNNNQQPTLFRLSYYFLGLNPSPQFKNGMNTGTTNRKRVRVWGWPDNKFVQWRYRFTMWGYNRQIGGGIGIEEDTAWRIRKKRKRIFYCTWNFVGKTQIYWRIACQHKGLLSFLHISKLINWSDSLTHMIFIY